MMKPAIFISVVIGAAVGTLVAGIIFLKTAEGRYEQLHREFRETCLDVGGKAVWNGKYWECLK